MHKSDLLAALAEETALTLRKCEEIVNLVFETMSRALIQGARIEVRGFGTFAVKEYRSYTGRNPKTGEKIAVGIKRLPYFKMAKDLREKANSRR